MTLRRGFKAGAERRALALRSELGLSAHDPLDVGDLAKHLGVVVVSAEELVDICRLEEIERIQAFVFSACTFEIEGRPVVVVNPLRTPPRQASDLAHELAHQLLGHQLSELRQYAGTTFRTCRPDEEEEATALGGTLMLPRPLLAHAARRGLGISEIARFYGVTEEMARYRFNTTGIARQMGGQGRVRNGKES